MNSYHSPNNHPIEKKREPIKEKLVSGKLDSLVNIDLEKLTAVELEI
jgi:hypothetical protein